MNTFLDHQNWRYATKKFDSSKKISNQDFELLLEAIRLSSSSYGLQPYKILIIENQDLRAKIQQAAWGQSQVVDASHLLIFANQTDISDAQIDEFFENTSKTRGIEIESLAGYQGFMKSKINELSADAKNIWNSKQTYLALANLMNAAAELKIDVTPMEGFSPADVNEILGLKELGLNASLLAPIGYRHSEDATQHYKKVRKSKEELFITI
ncbi:NAD(P)H-dependent oxidoreductase [Flavobacterium nackdongense]|uniref:NAD(P)H-dependent oxidoreductase n=1 Tax=Flavobacterium nackdongense TaxID=2547394 RepID=A0A4P6Y6M2_9FLAO|nr:NAD(P)H-dependent oxidoreductase [Flavobacterium nackdongense]QBN18081.1 NAD(P)H-dependent oxidoreductase [Flavobacterium nackdongense]